MDLPHRIYMAEHEMAVNTVARQHRTLEIHALSERKPAKRTASKRFRYDIK